MKVAGVPRPHAATLNLAAIIPVKFTLARERAAGPHSPGNQRTAAPTTHPPLSPRPKPPPAPNRLALEAP
jgi:hypothetical protein